MVGHDPGGDRYSTLTQITPANVRDLKVAWVYHMKPAAKADASHPDAHILPERASISLKINHS